MRTRITDRDLDGLCNTLNKITNSPATPYTPNESGSGKANIGNYHISHAYGGVSLHRMCNEHGGITEVLTCGHMPKRELYNRMHAFLDGLLASQP